VGYPARPEEIRREGWRARRVVRVRAPPPLQQSFESAAKSTMSRDVQLHPRWGPKRSITNTALRRQGWAGTIWTEVAGTNAIGCSVTGICALRLRTYSWEALLMGTREERLRGVLITSLRICNIARLCRKVCAHQILSMIGWGRQVQRFLGVVELGNFVIKGLTQKCREVCPEVKSGGSVSSVARRGIIRQHEQILPTATSVKRMVI